MDLGILLALAAIAPAPTADDVDPRAADGPTAVPAPDDAELPLIAPVGGEQKPEAAVAEPPTREKVVPPDDDEDASPEQPQVPRALSTIEGHRESEQAKFWNKRRTLSFIPDFQMRSQVGFASPFTLDNEGNRYTEGVQLTGRARWRPVLGIGQRQNVKLAGMIDIANGRWAPSGSPDPVIDQVVDDGQPPVRTMLRIVDPRELYVEWTSSIGQLRLGQMAFTWGQGLLANDGNNMDRFGDLKFGNDGDGLLVERILFGTKPFQRLGGWSKDLILALGADLVYRDPRASLLEGDLAGQGIFVLRWQPEDRPGNWVGAYAVYRRQRDADDGDVYDDDEDLEVGVVDFAGQGWTQLRPKLALIGAFETVIISGRTTFLRGDRSSHQVLQGGAALRGYIGNPERWLAGFDAGYASGDADPDDDQVNNFKAAPGFTAGLLMFQYLHGWQTARSQILAEDPDLTGVPQNGTQFIPSQGSVTNALFAQPKAQFGFEDLFEIWGGPLFAVAPVPIVDPYTTRLAGGSARNSVGGDGSNQYLGTELDLGIRSRYPYRNVWLQGGVQGGVLFPGPAFTDQNGTSEDSVWGFWFRFEVRF